MRSFLFSCLFLFIYSGLVSQKSNEDNFADSLLKYSNVVDDTTACRALQMRYSYFKLRDPVKAVVCAKDYYECAFKYRDDQQILDALMIMGGSYIAVGEFDSAELYMNKFYEASKQQGHKANMSLAKVNLALIQQQSFNFTEASRYAIEGLELAESVNNNKMIGFNLVVLSKIYKDQREYRQSINTGLKILKMDKSPQVAIDMLNTIGDSYAKLGIEDSALYYFNKGLNLADSLGLDYVTAIFNLGIGQQYLNLHEYDRAQPYIEKANIMGSKTGEIRVIQITNLLKAGLYLVREEYDMALKQTEEVIPYFESVEDYSNLFEAREIRVQVHKALHDDSERAHEMEQMLFLKDSIFNLETFEKSKIIQDKYEADKKDQQIAFLSEKEELQAEKLKKEKTVRNVLILGFAVFLVLSAVVVWNYRQKQKARRLVLEKDEELKQQQAHMNGQEEERKRIAKELHDGLGGTLAAIKMSLTEISSSSKSEKVEDVISNMDDAYQEVRNISHDLMPLALKGTSLVDAIKAYTNKLSKSYKFKIRVECFPEEKLNQLPHYMQLDIYRIIQELLNNTLKHAKASVVDVALSLENDQVDLIVEDDGNGFDVESVSQGIGLKNIQSRVELLNGNVQIDSKKDKGTAFHVWFTTKKHEEPIVS